MDKISRTGKKRCQEEKRPLTYNESQSLHASAMLHGDEPLAGADFSGKTLNSILREASFCMKISYTCLKNNQKARYYFFWPSFFMPH